MGVGARKTFTQKIGIVVTMWSCLAAQLAETNSAQIGMVITTIAIICMVSIGSQLLAGGMKMYGVVIIVATIVVFSLVGRALGF